MKGAKTDVFLDFSKAFGKTTNAYNWLKAIFQMQVLF